MEWSYKRALKPRWQFTVTPVTVYPELTVALCAEYVLNDLRVIRAPVIDAYLIKLVTVALTIVPTAGDMTRAPVV
jgi:hypothetical protein